MPTPRVHRASLSLASVLVLTFATQHAHANMTIHPMVHDMPPTEKPYQLVYVGDDASVQPNFRNSIYAASFGSTSGKQGEERLNSDDPQLPLSERFAIEGYARFIQIKDDGKVIRWDVADYPAIESAGENKHGTLRDFANFIAHYNTPQAKPLSVLNYLQPLHSIDYTAGKLMGQQTFIGRYVVWDMTKPTTAQNGLGTLTADNVQVNAGSVFNNWKEVRVRQAKFSSNGDRIYGVVRSEEEDPGSKEFKADLTYFLAHHLYQNKALERKTIKKASSGHALFMAENVIYTGGRDFRKIDEVTGSVTRYTLPKNINFGEESPAFLNMIVDEAHHRLYAVNSRDIDPDETGAKTYSDYLAKFADFAKAHRHGLYVFDIKPDNSLALVHYQPMIQPIELVLTRDKSTLFVNDRIARTVNAYDAQSLQPKGAVETTCHNSNLAQGEGNSLYVTSVYTYQLHLIGADDKDCNSISKVAYDFK